MDPPVQGHLYDASNSWSRVLPEKLIVAQLINKFSDFYEA